MRQGGEADGQCWQPRHSQTPLSTAVLASMKRMSFWSITPWGPFFRKASKLQDQGPGRQAVRTAVWWQQRRRVRGSEQWRVDVWCASPPRGGGGGAPQQARSGGRGRAGPAQRGVRAAGEGAAGQALTRP